VLTSNDMRRVIPLVVCIVTSSISASASAGFIADENAKPGTEWQPKSDGTSCGSGVADVYPAQWSIARGETIRLKVRSTTAYSLHVYRLGFYGGSGAHEVATRTGLSADAQPYPTADGVTGITRASWHDSVTVPTDAGWTPGIYVARIDQTGGAQAATFFVIRDDGFAPRPRILVVVGTNTHQAYNAWPGPMRGGKSLYGFNSSESSISDGDLNQAVKVSYDRPFFVGTGLADLGNYEVPYLRWLEKNGWDVAYATDQDLHADPGLVSGRNVITLGTHWEYVSRGMVEHMRAARDAGVNLLFLTGDTISYQVRFEDGMETMVGYKESWRHDPENIAGDDARSAGNLAEAKSHYRMVSRGWRNVGNPLTNGEPGMLLTGVHSAGAFGPSGPWGDLVIEHPEHWIYEGTGFSAGDRITRVMGYEFDSAELGNPEWDPFRPEGQVILGTIVRPSTGEKRGNASYYRAKSGAEVVALGAVEFAWALDRSASTWGDSTDARAQRMITNALTRFTSGAPPVEVDAGPPPEDDASVSTDASVSVDDASPVDDASVPVDDASIPVDGAPVVGADDAEGDLGTSNLAAIENPGVGSGCGCEAGARSGRPFAALAILALSAWLRRRRA
jgi:hypothetical protein